MRFRISSMFLSNTVCCSEVSTARIAANCFSRASCIVARVAESGGDPGVIAGICARNAVVIESTFVFCASVRVIPCISISIMRAPPRP